jgi:hypothetical protein
LAIKYIIPISGQINIEVGMSKKCFKCGFLKELNEFYKHKQMPDGHVNKCKTCNKEDVAIHRIKNIEKIREYDRNRGNRQGYEYVKGYREAYPNKYRATTMVNNAVRKKQLFPQPCEVCLAAKTVAHHDDYLKPLNVRWMCQAHHKQWHAKNGSGLNG